MLRFERGPRETQYPLPPMVLSNARSIGNKTSILQSFFAGFKVALACMTETWICNEVTVAITQLGTPRFIGLSPVTDYWVWEQGFYVDLRGFLL